MPARLTALLIILAAVLAAPAAATASPASGNAIPLSRALYIQQGSSMAEVQSMSSVPLGFTASAGRAVLAAEHARTMQQLHRRIHPLRVWPYVWRAVHPYWYVVFTYGKGLKIVATANVSPRGKVLGVWTGRQAAVPYAHGGWSWSVSSWLIYGPAALLFMLVFFDPRRLRRIVHLDALAVLGFLASYFLLADQHLSAAVWLVYPPLIYLFVRLLRLGFARGAGSGRLAPLLSTRTLLIGLPLMVIARIVLSLVGHQEIDVGYESVIGASRILHHLPLYYNDPNHGDTYGPITYLAYVPFELIFPWKSSLNDLHAADLAAIVFDLGTIAGLFLTGRRLRSGREGTRIGLLLAWAWAACPFTLVSLVVHTNDGLISMLTVFAVLLFTWPLASGAMLGLAAAAKFSPAGLLPLLAAPRQRGWRGALTCVLVFVAVVAVAIYAWLPPQGFGYFWQRTIHFQMTRFDVFSPWALHPALHPLQTALEVLAVVLAGAVAFVPRRRSLVQLCALAGAVTIAVQLPATHWYYYYIMWFLPFALVAFVARPALVAEPATEAARREWTIQPAEHEPAMAGA
jgi:Glycosyltransferase family 87